MITVKHSKDKSEQGYFTLQEIASMMNLTKERVRQIEAQPLMKLRINLASKRIDLTDLLGRSQ